MTPTAWWILLFHHFTPFWGQFGLLFGPLSIFWGWVVVGTTSIRQSQNAPSELRSGKVCRLTCKLPILGFCKGSFIFRNYTRNVLEVFWVFWITSYPKTPPKTRPLEAAPNQASSGASQVAGFTSRSRIRVVSWRAKWIARKLVPSRQWPAKAHQAAKQGVKSHPQSAGLAGAGVQARASIRPVVGPYIRVRPMLGGCFILKQLPNMTRTFT